MPIAAALLLLPLAVLLSAAFMVAPASAPVPESAPFAAIADGTPCTVDPERQDPLLPSRDLYCMSLVAIPGLEGVRAEVELGWASTPFGVAVAPDGVQRYDAVLHLEGLPDPSTFGPYTGYAAWLTTPLLDPETPLGPVGNGVQRLGILERDRFLILITAEADPGVEAPAGRIVLRGVSPSTRMQPADIHEFLVGTLGVEAGTRTPGAAAVSGQPDDPVRTRPEPDPTPADPHAGHPPGATPAPRPVPDPHAGHAAPAPAGGIPVVPDAHATHADWPHPPMPEGLVMLPSEMALVPPVRPDLPPDDPAAPPARASEPVLLADGDTLHLRAAPVRWTVRGQAFTGLGFNGQLPGPMIRIPEGATVHVVVTNDMDRPTAVHWHGIRLENPYDGAPPRTQPPIQPGETFHYRIHAPDPGIYWYHAHFREDLQQDLGLFANLQVISRDPGFLGEAHRDAFLLLDDFLLGDEGPIPFGLEAVTHALMGRFGNVLLVNGREGGELLEARKGEVIRLLLTNASNTRTFNLSIPGVRMKVVGSDVGAFVREEWVESVVVAPAERYVVLARFDEEGDVPLLNRVRAIDHLFGVFLPQEDTLGVIRVTAGEGASDPISLAFDTLHDNDAAREDLVRVLAHRDRPVDRALLFQLDVGDVPLVTDRLLQFDSVYFHPVEWEGTMPMMNMATTGLQVRWLVRDPADGAENHDIDWRFRVGDVVKVRLANLRETLHGMQHPFHIHGQRFVVVSRNGVPVENPVWKDTVLLPAGTTADILLELSNPGIWMMHCHISEHMEAGMMAHFTVEGEDLLRGRGEVVVPAMPHHH